MFTSTGGMSPLGTIAAIAAVAGIALLVAYAVRRGLVNRELDGTLNRESSPEGVLEPGPSATPQASRLLGSAGALLLAVGLVLGVVAVVVGPSASNGSAGTPVSSAGDCAQSWNGCPQVTAQPSGTP